MRVGFETIAWGPWIDDLASVLDTIAAAGYQGVEFSQRPECFGDITSLLNLLEARGLSLIGLVGGSLLERMRFCKNNREAYLVIHDWHPHAKNAMDEGFRLALHPHVYQPHHHLNDALELLTQYPPLEFLPDTAILTIVGDDPAKAVQEAIKLGKNRLAAVHLKDWSPVFGRSAHRYERGFTELGKGEVPLDDVIDALQAADYGGWLVVEQDNPRKGPQHSLSRSTKWLAERTILPSPVSSNLYMPNLTAQSQLSTWVDAPELESRFLQAVIQASTENLNKCYQTIVMAMKEFVPSHLVTLWSCNPAHDLMSLLACNPSDHATNIDDTVSLHSSLSEIAIERQKITRFSLVSKQPAIDWGYPDRQYTMTRLVEEMQLQDMISLPILSASSPHHARLLIEIFPEDASIPVPDDVLSRLASYAATAADSALDERCAYAAARTNHAAAKSNIASATTNIRVSDTEHVQDFLKMVRRLIEQLLKCQYVSIFLVNATGDRLELVESNANLIWRSHSTNRYYKKGQGLTGTVWATKEAILSTNPKKEPNHVGLSTEPAYGSPESYLCSPLVNQTGEVVGVIRCHNKLPSRPGTFSMFTYDDVAVIDAIGQAAGPHLQLLRNNEHRVQAINRLTHELKVPLSTIQSAVDRMIFSLKKRNLSVNSVFDHDYIKNILSYTALMSRLIDHIEILRKSPYDSMQIEKVFLMGDIIAPVVQQIDAILEEREFPRSGIRYGSFSQIPALYVDKNRFQQVFFNLLSNAIKYAYKDRGAFQVEIDGDKEMAHYVIYFRDWGMGIRNGDEEAIFREGYRVPDPRYNNITGEGLGLWIVRQVIGSHGGTVKLTNNQLPTEFKICLPISLSIPRR